MIGKTIHPGRVALIVVWMAAALTDPVSHAGEYVKIAAIFSQSGIAAEQNSTSLRGVRLAVRRVKKSGGILGRLIDLYVFDNKSTPIGSKIAAQQAVDANVSAIIGPAWSSHARIVARIAQDRKIPMITNAATAPGITLIGDYIFRVCYTDIFQSQVLERFAREELGAGTAVILTDILSEDSMALSALFEKNFKANGGRVLLSLRYKHSENDYSPLLKKIVGLSPDIILIPGHGESGAIIKQSVELGIDGIFLGGAGWEDTFFFKNGGKLLKKGYYCTHWSKESDIGESRDFIKYHPSQLGLADLVLGYDATMVLMEAIERTGSDDPQKIREALAVTSHFSGITGSITFDQNGDPRKNAVLMKIENGQASYVKTVYP